MKHKSIQGIKKRPSKKFWTYTVYFIKHHQEVHNNIMLNEVKVSYVDYPYLKHSSFPVLSAYDLKMWLIFTMARNLPPRRIWMLLIQISIYMLCDCWEHGNSHSSNNTRSNQYLVFWKHILCLSLKIEYTTKNIFYFKTNYRITFSKMQLSLYYIKLEIMN